MVSKGHSECLFGQSLVETSCSTTDVPSNVDTLSSETLESQKRIINNSNLGNEVNMDELEQYLSGILSGLHKQQENQKNEVLQLILKQHQEIQDGQQKNHQFSPSTANSNIHSSNQIKPNSIGTSSAWTFTEGLILGQLSVIILFIAFIKFFVFTEATPTQASSIPSNKNVSVIKASRKSDELDISRLQTAPMSRLNTDRGSNLSLHDTDITNNIKNGNSDNFNNNSNSNNSSNYNQILGVVNDNIDNDSTLNSILEKTYYDVKSHQPESLDWFNVLVAQIIAQARVEALNNGNIYESLNTALNSPSVLQYFDKMNITEINIGNDYPIFSNCRVKNNEGRLEAKIDVDVSDTITLGVETNLLINQPKFMSASLPIKLAISVVRFSACLTVSLISIDEEDEDIEVDEKTSNDSDEKTKTDNTNSDNNKNNNMENVENAETARPNNHTSNNSNNNNNNNNNNNIGTDNDNDNDNNNTNNGANNTSPENIKDDNNYNSNTNTNSDNDNSERKKGHSIALMFSFSPDFRLEFDIKSLIGSRAKLENIPRISSILENVIRKWFIERCIEPRFQLIRLPSMWPRKKNTRQSKSAEY